MDCRYRAGHRVVPGDHFRRSAAFFHEANADALVEVLPTCVTAESPARYAPVRAGDARCD